MMELREQAPTDNELVDALHSLNVHFLLGDTGQLAPLSDEMIVRGLAESNDARVRLALIPLFLHHPRFASVVRQSDLILSGPGQLYLRCYYTAAHLLQQKYAAKLNHFFGQQAHLLDLFSHQLDISLVGSTQSNLEALANCHANLSGRSINWLGTYEHAATRTLKRLRHEELCRA